MKRRRGKGRMTPEEEITLWSTWWDGGSFLLAGADDELGVGGFAGAELYHDDAAKEWRETPDYKRFREEVIEPAAREAWQRLGADYLAKAEPKHSEHLPDAGAYALAHYGKPK